MSESVIEWSIVSVRQIERGNYDHTYEWDKYNKNVYMNMKKNINIDLIDWLRTFGTVCVICVVCMYVYVVNVLFYYS